MSKHGYKPRIAWTATDDYLFISSATSLVRNSVTLKKIQDKMQNNDYRNSPKFVYHVQLSYQAHFEFMGRIDTRRA